jgi:hypothetical protein
MPLAETRKPLVARSGGWERSLPEKLSDTLDIG